MDEKLVIQITAEIDDLKRQMAQAKDEVRDMADEAKKSTADIDETFKKAGSSIKTSLGVAAKAGAAAFGALTGALVLLTEGTEEYRRNQAMLTSAFEEAGSSANTAKDTYNDLYRVLGDTGQATEASQQLAKLTNDEKALSEYTNILQGVYATFGESLPIEGLAEAMNHTAKLGEVQGSLADALEWSGVNVDEFNAQLAACSDESEREKLIRETLNGMYSESAAAYEKNSASILAANEAQAKLDSTLAATGEALAPVMTTLKELAADVLTAIQPYIQSFAENYLPVIRDVLGEVGGKLSETFKWMSEHKALLGVIAGIIATVVTAIGLYNAVAAIKVAMDAAQVTSLGALVAAQLASAAATAAALAPYIAIVAAIAAVIAIIVLCVKNWDDIKKKVKEVWDDMKKKVSDGVENVKKKLEDMKKAAGDKIEALKKTVTDKFEAIKKAITDKAESAKQAVVEKFTQIKQNIDEKVQQAKDSVTNKFEEIKQNISNKITATKETISSAFAAIKEVITDKITQAKTSALSIFESITSGIKSKINAAKDAVQTAINKIKSIMNFKWSLPKLKMPTIKISGKFSINPPSVPKFSVSWNAKGGVFDKPTLFGYGDSLQGIGEAGAEAVVPLENNLEWLDKLAGMLDERMNNGKSTPIILQVDGKTLAQTTVDGINKLTRQTGKLPLNLV